MSDEVKTKYQAMVDDFKRQCEGLLGQSAGAFNEIVISANMNFNNVQQSYIKGAGDMKNEILKGNMAMVESFRKNCKMIQQNIDDTYNTLKGENMDVFSKNISKFQEQCDNAVKKVPLLSSSNYSSVIQHLVKKQKETLELAQVKHKAIAKQLQDSYEDTASKLTMTMKDLTPK